MDLDHHSAARIAQAYFGASAPPVRLGWGISALFIYRLTYAPLSRFIDARKALIGNCRSTESCAVYVSPGFTA